MARKIRSFRVGKVVVYLRGKIWYLCYYEHGRRCRPRVGPDKELARQLAAQTNAQLEVCAPTALSFEPVSIAELRDRWLHYHEHVLRSSVATVQRYRAASAHLLNFARTAQPVTLAAHFRATHAEAFAAYLRRIPLPRRALGVGGFGLTNTNGLQINQFGLATAFKWQGFSARGEYILRTVDPRDANANWWLMTRQGNTTVQHGAYLQMGYFLPIPGLEKKLEAVARVGGISALANGRECAWEYSGGLNYFLHKDKVKLQADVTKITEVPISSDSSSMANVNDQPLIFRVQLQVKF